MYPYLYFLIRTITVFWRGYANNPFHSASVVHSTSYSDVTSRGRPNLGPYVSFPDVLLRSGVRRTLFVRSIRTWRRWDVFYTSATNKDVRKTYIWAQIRSSFRRSGTSCRLNCVSDCTISAPGDHQFCTTCDAYVTSQNRTNMVTKCSSLHAYLVA